MYVGINGAFLELKSLYFKAYISRLEYITVR